MNDPEMELHLGEAKGQTRIYPDAKSAEVAANEFKARVVSIAEEMGAHSLFVVADFFIEPRPGKKPGDRSSQCVVLWGCVKCLGYEVARSLHAIFPVVQRFLDGFSAAAVEGLAKEMMHLSMARKSEQAKQKGFDA